MTYNTREDQIRDLYYHAVCENLSNSEVLKFICAIQESDQYELGQYSHIFLRNSDSIIGYIGDDEFDLVDKGNESLHKHHSALIDILSKCLD